MRELIVILTLLSALVALGALGAALWHHWQLEGPCPKRRG